METTVNATTNGSALIRSVTSWDTPEGISTIRQTVARGSSDSEFAMFLEVCRATGLNPFLREIWFVSQTKTIMAGRDGYLAIANRHPMFDGIESYVVEWDKDTQLPIRALCKVYRKDRSHPTVCEAWFREYRKESPVWRQYPSAMLIKVAEVMALKRSFAINGVVTEEEIGLNPAPPTAAEQAEIIARERVDNPPQDAPTDEQRERLKALLDQGSVNGRTRRQIETKAAGLKSRIEFENAIRETEEWIKTRNGKHVETPAVSGEPVSPRQQLLEQITQKLAGFFGKLDTMPCQEYIHKVTKGAYYTADQLAELATENDLKSILTRMNSSRSTDATR